MKICQSCIEWIWEVFGHVTETDPEATHQEIVDRSQCEFGPHLAENRVLQSHSDYRKRMESADEFLKNFQILQLAFTRLSIGGEQVISPDMLSEIVNLTRKRLKTALENWRATTKKM